MQMSQKTRDEELDAFSRFLATLAHPTRIRILRALSKPKTMEELANMLTVTKEDVERHLGELVKVKLVAKRRRVGQVIYRLTPVAENLLNITWAAYLGTPPAPVQATSAEGMKPKLPRIYPRLFGWFERRTPAKLIGVILIFYAVAGFINGLFTGQYIGAVLWLVSFMTLGLLIYKKLQWKAKSETDAHTPYS